VGEIGEHLAASSSHTKEHPSVSSGLLMKKKWGRKKIKKRRKEKREKNRDERKREKISK
jgi:hypothetical protein